MKDLLWFLVVGSFVLLIYVAIAQIFWAIFCFVDNGIIHTVLTMFGVYFFHTKMIFKGF